MFSRSCLINADTYGKYGIDDYYAYNDECNGHRHCDRLTYGSFRCLVKLKQYDYN
jgi:hypothetical protein